MNDKTKPGDSDVTEATSPENTDTGKSLDDLLAEFDDKGTKQADSKESDQGEIAALKEQVNVLLEREADRSYKGEMNDFIIPTLKGDLEIDDFYVEAWANKQAQDDPRLQALWDERGTKRAEFQKAITLLAPKFQKSLEGKILVNQKQSTDDSVNESELASAVRKARESNSTPTSLDDANLGAMSDQEFQLHKQEVFRLQMEGKLK
jgi:hypothetical protein